MQRVECLSENQITLCTFFVTAEGGVDVLSLMWETRRQTLACLFVYLRGPSRVTSRDWLMPDLRN